MEPPAISAQGSVGPSGESVDLVVVSVYLGNDVDGVRTDYIAAVQPTPRPRLRVPRSFSLVEWIESIARPIDFSLRGFSHFYVLGRSVLETLRMRVGLSTIYFPEEYSVTEEGSARWDDTALTLLEIAQVAEAHETPILFIFVPAYFQVDARALNQHIRAFGLDPASIRIDQPNDLLGGRLRAMGLRVLDPLPALRAAQDEGLRPYGSVDTHFSATGHAVTWDFVRDTIVKVLQERRP
jgi:hypothetical protein